MLRDPPRQLWGLSPACWPQSLSPGGDRLLGVHERGNPVLGRQAVGRILTCESQRANPHLLEAIQASPLVAEIWSAVASSLLP